MTVWSNLNQTNSVAAAFQMSHREPARCSSAAFIPPLLRRLPVCHLGPRRTLSRKDKHE